MAKPNGKKKKASESASSYSPPSPPAALFPPPEVVTNDLILFFKIYINGLYLEPVLYGGTDYRGYILGGNTFPDIDESIDEIFYRERRKLLATGKNGFDKITLKSIKHMNFHVLYQNAIALVVSISKSLVVQSNNFFATQQYREKSFTRGDVKKYTKDRLVSVLNFRTPRGRKATRQVLFKHNIFVRGEARSLLSNNAILMTRFHEVIISSMIFIKLCSNLF